MVVIYVYIQLTTKLNTLNMAYTLNVKFKILVMLPLIEEYWVRSDFCPSLVHISLEI